MNLLSFKHFIFFLTFLSFLETTYSQSQVTSIEIKNENELNDLLKTISRQKNSMGHPYGILSLIADEIDDSLTENSCEEFQKKNQGQARSYVNSQTPESLFKSPGNNWKYCDGEKVEKTNDCSLGWPGPSAYLFKTSKKEKKITKNPYNYKVNEEIKKLEAEVKNTEDPSLLSRLQLEYKKFTEDSETPEEEELLFQEVEYCYHRKVIKTYKTKNGQNFRITINPGRNQNKGWIEADMLTDKKPKTLQTNKPKVDCEPNTPQKEVKKTQQSFKPLAEAIEKLTSDKFAELHADKFGLCTLENIKKPVSKKTDKKKNSTQKKVQRYANPKVSIYDEEVLKKSKNKIDQSLQNINKTPPPINLTQQQYIEIDAFARTLYGEMASCYKYGDQYPMTIARIMLNRALEIDKNDKKKNEYLRGSIYDQTKKTVLAAVPTTAVQFSVWNHGKGNNLKQALCPPISKNKSTYDGSMPSDNLVNVWKKSIEIAQEVVLNKESFMKKTNEVTARHYTSNMIPSWASKCEKTSPTVAGQKVDIDRCLMVWNCK